MPLHKKTGSLMIEVLLALAVLVMSLGPIMIAQAGKVRASSTSARLFDRVEQAIQFMYTQLMQPRVQATATKKITQPLATLSFTFQKPPATSSLHVFQSIDSARVTIAWRDGVTDLRDTIVTCRYKQPEEQA